MKHSNEVRNTHTLPTAYQFNHTFNLKKDKKVSLIIQITFIVIALIVVGLAILFQFPLQNELKTFTSILLTIGLVIVYAIVHELTHGVFIHILSKENQHMISDSRIYPQEVRRILRLRVLYLSHWHL